MISRLLLAALSASLLLGCRAEPGASPSQPAQVSPAGLDVVPVKIRSGAQEHSFNVEVARTEEEQAQGLMFREQLGPNEGMIFPFVPPRPASFWMKNTPIPLDLLFVRADCSVASIAVNTIPQSLEPYAVAEPVAAVLELAGGRTIELGINEGDCVTWPGGPQ